MRVWAIGLTLAIDDPGRTVHLIDINERAVRLCEKNARQNKVDNVVIYQSDGFQNVEQQKFAAIVTNPPIRAGKSVVHDMLTHAFHHLLPGGELWTVIQKKQGRLPHEKKLEQTFGNAQVVVKKKRLLYFIGKKN